MPSNFLKVIRDKKNLSIADLAKVAGVSRYVIWRFESQNKIPSKKILDKITQALDVSFDYIMTGKEEPNISEDAKKEYFLKAVTMAKEFYDDNNFSDKLMINISTELYMLLAKKEKIKNKEEVAAFKKLLEENYSLGLASKCFLESMKKKQ